MKTTEQKLDDLIDTEIEYLTSLCLHNNYDELYQTS
jgi:predicted nucleic-acid-binding Zn-ribbon protein